MIQFFAPEISKIPILPEAESQHAIKVLRMRAGDEIEITDGCGKRYMCRILDPHQKHVLVEIIDAFESPNPWSSEIIMAVAPTKHLDRIEWMVEKMVEIGVNRVVPLLCHRSERRELKVDRLKKIAVSAMNQSLKSTLPVIEPMTRLDHFVGTLPDGFQRFVGYCDDSVERRLLSRSLAPNVNTVIMVGPEGDFSPDEIALMLNAGFSPVSFGETRLRTETAAVCSLETVHIINQLG